MKFKRKMTNKLRHAKIHKVVDLMNKDTSNKSKDNEGIINKVKNSPPRVKAKLMRECSSH